MSSPHSLVFGTTLPKILIITTWINANVRGPTWHILSGLKTRESEGDETLDHEGKFRQFPMCVGARFWYAGCGTCYRCAVIKDLSGYQQPNPVSSVAAPAARPKTEEYLRISHIGSLIAVKYYYFSHFRWLTNCLSTAPVGPRRFPIYYVLSMYTNPFLSFSFSFFGTFFYFIFIFIILPLAPVSSRVITVFLNFQTLSVTRHAGFTLWWCL